MYSCLNFNIPREVYGGTVIETAYAGAKATHLPGAINQNQLSPENQALGSAVLQKQVPIRFMVWSPPELWPLRQSRRVSFCGLFRSTTA
jgi:hypothetical protein